MGAGLSDVLGCSNGFGYCGPLGEVGFASVYNWLL